MDELGRKPYGGIFAPGKLGLRTIFDDAFADAKWSKHDPGQVERIKNAIITALEKYPGHAGPKPLLWHFDPHAEFRARRAPRGGGLTRQQLWNEVKADLRYEPSEHDFNTALIDLRCEGNVEVVEPGEETEYERDGKIVSGETAYRLVSHSERGRVAERAERVISHVDSWLTYDRRIPPIRSIDGDLYPGESEERAEDEERREKARSDFLYEGPALAEAFETRKCDSSSLLVLLNHAEADDFGRAVQLWPSVKILLKRFALQLRTRGDTDLKGVIPDNLGAWPRPPEAYGAAAIESDDRQAGKGGRKAIGRKEAERRREILAKWEQAKAAGIQRKDFCADKRISVGDLKRFVDWAEKQPAEPRITTSQIERVIRTKC